MTIQAATLAGGSNNQDRYIVGDGFAAVLDGATSFAGDRSHDPGWYAEQLGQALTVAVPANRSLAEAVTDAIRTVRDAHHLRPETTPTSTIALARWTADTVETYLLGDSFAVILRDDGTEELHDDDRLSAVAVAERAAYRSRLADGGGYDDAHRAQLLSLQAEQSQHRNRPGGYWIAGVEAEAGQHGITRSTAREQISAVVLASDGVALDRHPTANTWRDLYDEMQRDGAAAVLQRIHDAENTDPNGQRWPRAKIHDDKTIIITGMH
jgi:serine/threonine protein phosphatase PrpC